MVTLFARHRSVLGVMLIALASVVFSLSASAADARSTHEASCTTKSVAHAARIYLEHHGDRRDLATFSLYSYKCVSRYALATLGTTKDGGYGEEMSMKRKSGHWHGMHTANLFNEQSRGGIPKKSFRRLSHARTHTLKRGIRL